MSNYDEVKKFICWVIPLSHNRLLSDQTQDFTAINTVIMDLVNAGEEVDLITNHFRDKDGTYCLRIELTCPM